MKTFDPCDCDQNWPSDGTEDEEAEAALQEEIDEWEEGRPHSVAPEWDEDDDMAEGWDDLDFTDWAQN